MYRMKYELDEQTNQMEKSIGSSVKYHRKGRRNIHYYEAERCDRTILCNQNCIQSF